VTIESKKLGTRELWFSACREYSAAVADDRYDAFLIGMLYPAMKYGEDLYIDGTVSHRLLTQVNQDVIPLILSFSPSCKKIKVSAAGTSSESYGGEKIGTGFSGGIDSFCTIYDHFATEPDPGSRISVLLFFNVGSHGSFHEDMIRDQFSARYEYLKQFTDEIGLDFIPIDSNLYQFHPWSHQRTHTLTSVSAVLFFQKLLRRFYYASTGLSYSEMPVYASKYKDFDIGGFCDPSLLPLLSTESTEFISDGMQYSRVDKTKRLTAYEPVYRYLNVCASRHVDSHENCSVCLKCCRTMMTLDSIGKLQDFDRVFDIEKYRSKAEKKYICLQVALQNKDAFAKSNVELARMNHFPLPGRFRATLISLPGLLKNWGIHITESALPDLVLNQFKKLILK
jgi:hypothetical protein